jgi:hypothetical protein
MKKNWACVIRDVEGTEIKRQETVFRRSAERHVRYWRRQGFDTAAVWMMFLAGHGLRPQWTAELVKL